MSEQWVEVPIKPFSEYYLISNTGKVFSKHCNRVLSPKLNPGGYEHITLCAHGQQQRILIHRLVALAFIENPENKPTVNHINENKRDNRAENLEWATIREQNIHGTRIERAMAHTDWAKRTESIDYYSIAQKHDYAQPYMCNRKKTSVYINGVLWRVFNTQKEAAIATGVTSV